MSGAGGFPEFPSGQFSPGRPGVPGLKPEWFIGLGAVFLVLGVLAFVDAVLTTLVSVVFLGIVLIIAGCVQLGQSFAHREVPLARWWLPAVTGALYVLGGAVLIREPVTGSVFLTAFLAGCLIFSGVTRAVWAAGHRSLNNWWGVVLSGVVTLLVGILVYVTLPWSGVWLIGTFIGIELVIGGVSAIAFGVALRNGRGG